MKLALFFRGGCRAVAGWAVGLAIGVMSLGACGGPQEEVGRSQAAVTTCQLVTMPSSQPGKSTKCPPPKAAPQVSAQVIQQQNAFLQRKAALLGTELKNASAQERERTVRDLKESMLGQGVK